MTRAQMAALLVGRVFLVVGIGSAGCVGGRSSGQEHPRLPIGHGTAPDLSISRCVVPPDNPAAGDVEAVVSGCGEGRLQLVCRDDRHAEPEGHSDAIGGSAIHGDHAITMPQLQLRVERLGPAQ
jgi:hypothetical protein